MLDRLGYSPAGELVNWYEAMMCAHSINRLTRCTTFQKLLLEWCDWPRGSETEAAVEQRMNAHVTVCEECACSVATYLLEKP